MKNLKEIIFEILENLLSCGEEFEDPKSITNNIINYKMVPPNSNPIIIEELVKYWMVLNKHHLNNPNLPN